MTWLWFSFTSGTVQTYYSFIYISITHLWFSKVINYCLLGGRDIIKVHVVFFILAILVLIMGVTFFGKREVENRRGEMPLEPDM